MAVIFLEWNDPDAFAKRCEEYFALVDANNEKREASDKKPHPPSIIGLQLHLQIKPADYRRYKTKDGYEAYRDIIERAEMMIEGWMTPRMMSGEISSNAGMIFLRNKHGFRDSSAEKSTNVQINPVDSEIKIVIVNGNGEQKNIPENSITLLPESNQPLLE